MSEPRFRLPEVVSGSNKYVHRKPRRPTHLPRRLTPPPERRGPPDLSLFLYAGLVLVLILVILAVPYIVGYLFEVLF
jgi:hypothetical protein